MKKSFSLLFVFLFLLSACTASAPIASPPTPRSEAHSYSSDLNDLDDVMRYSTNIVTATLVSCRDFDGSICVYTYDVVDDHTENTPEEIHVYDAYYEEYIPGHTYYLFLCSGESALYPHTIYTTVVKELILDTSAMSVSSTATQLSGDSEELVSLIRNATDKNIIGAYVEDSVSVTVSTSLSSLKTAADLIAEIKISGERTANVYASTYNIELVNLIKGPKDALPSLLNLPPGLSPETSYYVLLKEDPSFPGQYSLFSRVYPVIEVSAAEANLITE